jgi:mannose/fructose/N-acetylgalactosamine-specific phosphotransferase system component IIB
MTIWTVAQFALNLIFLAGIALCIIKLRARREEDPRLSYGLKLLQNKLAILEDLSDKTDHQVKRLITLLESKIKEVQSKVTDADSKLNAINEAMIKTLEVATIFKEQIPHEQIVEQKVTSKYVNAARLAHQGYTRDQIQKTVDLPDAELDLVIKLNRDQLMFAEEELPAWVDKNPIESSPDLYTPPSVDVNALSKMGDEFKKACEEFAKKNTEPEKPEKTGPMVVPYQFKRHDDIV